MTRGAAYVSFVESEIVWAKSNHLRATVIVSPYNNDQAFMAQTKTWVSTLQAANALPTEWAVENYLFTEPGVTIDNGSNPNSLTSVAHYLDTLPIPSVTPTPTPTSAAPGNSTPITTTNTALPAYRFFDQGTGTHLLTADAGERNTILATRPDLVEEINDFGTVASEAANALPVYRFFDTVDGTHFFTASASETQTIGTTRPDLVAEPKSVFYEDATPQTGDVAVYRMFDSQHGTHFYTGNQSEYAGLTTPGSLTYRADLVAEGVFFYAPAGSYS